MIIWVLNFLKWVYIYIYIYIYVCVCVCVCVKEKDRLENQNDIFPRGLTASDCK